jgi:hypothetical protein
VLNKIFKIVKKIITSSLLIYAYDSLSLALNIFIPINVVTISIVSIFGILGLFGIIVLSFFL